MELTKKDYYFASRASEYACKSPMMMQHGCVLVHHSQILSYGFNHYRTKLSSLSCSKPMCSCHAEMDALSRHYNRLRRKLNKTTYYSPKGSYKRQRFKVGTLF